MTDEAPERGECLNCAKGFTLSRPWQKFCGKKCRSEFHIQEVKQKSKARRKDAKPTANCKHCGTSFVPKTKWQEFCNPKHRIAHLRENK